ncbi:MAG TPA: PEP/pyruvate-binding domain-containing protein [Chloroflexota bacterium]|nr:PEP/pyruvate-binding domain-containing protein [Chloroflexota bacterium]
MKYVITLEETRRWDVETAGVKAANLGELAAAGLPVPPGFIVTPDAFECSMRAAGALTSIDERLAHLDRTDAASLQHTARELHAWIVREPFPDDVRGAITRAYRTLTAATGSDSVAVRTSWLPLAPGTDSSVDAPRPARSVTRLYVHGLDELLSAVRECWAALYGEDALARGVSGHMAVLVQSMVNAEKSGVARAPSPDGAHPDWLVIEAVWGAGEQLIETDVHPDRYVVERPTGRVMASVVGDKEFALIRDERGSAERVALDSIKGTERVLSEHEVQLIAELAIAAERRFGTPLSLEWATMGDHVFILEAREATLQGAHDSAAFATAR